MAVMNRVAGAYTLAAIDHFFEAFAYFSVPLTEARRAQQRRCLAENAPAQPGLPQVAPHQVRTGKAIKEPHLKTDYEKGFDAGWHAHRRGSPAKPLTGSSPDYAAGYGAGFGVSGHAATVQAGMQGVPTATGGGSASGRTDDYGTDDLPPQRKASQAAARNVFDAFSGVIRSSIKGSPHYQKARAQAAGQDDDALDQDVEGSWSARQIHASHPETGAVHKYTGAEHSINNFGQHVQPAEGAPGLEPHSIWRHLHGSLSQHYQAWQAAEAARKKREGGSIVKPVETPKWDDAPAPAAQPGAQPAAQPAPADTDDDHVHDESPAQPTQEPKLKKSAMKAQKVAQDKQAFANTSMQATGTDAPKRGGAYTHTGQGGGDGEEVGAADQHGARLGVHRDDPNNPHALDPSDKTHIMDTLHKEYGALHHPADWQAGQWSDREFVKRRILQQMSQADALRDMGIDPRSSHKNTAPRVEKSFRERMAAKLWSYRPTGFTPDSLETSKEKAAKARTAPKPDEPGASAAAAPTTEAPAAKKLRKKKGPAPEGPVGEFIERLFGIVLAEDVAAPVFDAWLSNQLNG